MKELRATLLEELIEKAYAELGEVVLSQEEIDILVAECVELVGQASYPPATQPSESEK